MEPLPVHNVGFGGSRRCDSVSWLETLLAGMQPRALVVFSGTNDLAGDEPRSADYLLDQFDALVTRFRALGHDAPLLYIAISPTPSREQHLARVLDVNQRIAARCAQDPRLHFIDTASALLDANGRPDPKWFVSDRLHLNADGYAAWAQTVRPALA
jgi:lysophospholipase L1-like esterase